MNVRNFLKKIISGFKESWDGRPLKKQIVLKSLPMDFFYPNLLDYNTEQNFKKGGFSYREEFVLLREYGINLKEIEASRLISFERLKIKKLNLCGVCDNPDVGFLVHDADVSIKIKKEKIFKIVIGKISSRPIFYMN